MPACRMAPPMRCFHCQAFRINSEDPASTAPTGAPRPLLRSIHRVSKDSAYVFGAMPDATVAFKSRAPSMCVKVPFSCARSHTARICSRGHIRPPGIFVVCSTQTSRKGGLYRVEGTITSAICSGVNMPFFPSMGYSVARASTAAPPASDMSGCAVRSTNMRSPARQ